MKHILIISMICWSISAFTPAFAVDFKTIKALDDNHDGFINDGPERNAVRNILDFADDHSQSLIHGNSNFAPPEKGVPIQNFAAPSGRCGNEEQYFFLRGKRVNTALLHPTLVTVAGDGASLSIKQNFDAKDFSVSTKSAATYVHHRDRCIYTRNYVPGTMILTGLAFSSYLEFDGSISSKSKPPSRLEVGLDARFQFFSGAFFDEQLFDFNPFIRTDFEGKASAYGLEANWIPFAADKHLGGYLGTDEFAYWWTLRLSAEILRVEKRGLLRLSSNTNYAWLGGEITGNIEYKKIFAKAEYSFYYDVFNNQDVDKVTGTVGFYLTDDKKTSLALEYARGTEHKKLSHEDLITINLKFKI